MTCYDAKEKIGMYMDAVLDDAETAEMADHLADCSACALVYASLKKVDDVFRTDFMPQPPPEYWNTLPQIVTRRLGLRRGRSVFKKVSVLMQEYFTPRGVKWGLVGAVAVSALIFSVKSFYLPSSEVSITQPSVIESGNNASQNPGASQNTPTQTPQQSEKETPVTEVELAAAPVSSSDYGESMSAGNVRRLPARLQSFTPPQQKKALYPTTSFNTDMFATLDEEEVAEDAAQWRVFALTLSGDSRRTSSSTEVSRIDDPQSSFSQTLWIVQQSTSMDEKRNIWLSYINREKDATYRALGIYNLALTLSKIAEDSKDSQNAKAALAFFKEHEDLLKIQMGNERYLLKTKVFESLIKN